MPTGNTSRLEAENRRLAAELAEAQEILRALRKGEVDALVGSESDSVYAVQLIALAVDKAETYNDALALLIGRLCDATRSDYCEAWAVTPTRRSLRRTPAWCGWGADAVRLHEAMANPALEPPAELLGVFRSGKPEWLAVKSMQGPYAQAMKDCELQSGLALPLVVDDRVLAVLTLWTQEPRARDNNVIVSAGKILDEAGRFVQRKLEQDNRQEMLQALRGVIRDRSRRVLELSGELDWKSREYTAAEVRSRKDQQARLRSEEALRQETALTALVLDGMMDGVVVTNTAGKVLRFNPAAQRLLGKPPGDVPVESWPAFYGLYRVQGGMPLSAAEMPVVKAARGEATSRMEIFVSNDVCRDRTLDVSASPLLSAGASTPFGAVMLLHDVSEQRRGESMRRISLVEQRDALVRQVHHNVKNSLAGIVALLQQRARDYPEMKEHMQDVESQLFAIASVHGMGAQNDSGVLLGGLVQSLGDSVHSLFGASMKIVRGDDDVWRLKLHESESVPLALALNELLVNACKHGKPQSLEFSAAREGEDLVITIANGAKREIRWVGDGPEGGAGRGLGIELVRSLLPHGKAHLHFQHSGARVEAILRLAPGVFQAAA
jgi:two-component sensor histidine kinase